MVTVEIDGREFQAQPGQTIIEVADQAGIYIPRFCYHEKLSVAANCRMCMVEVERAPKPLVACATPVADGMKVRTASSYAVGAQKDTLEFLLINHPLDCPICDQGGECPLQDQALGYGGDASRYVEIKRVVPDHSIGPLIATEMTRCIHCTRCVRFGEEVAGVMELGLTHRSEHLKIDTFFDRAVDSEVSGNVIDLCPVGALTSRPYRFTARSWEMISHDSVSPHDCVGTNINVQTLRGVVKRVLPRDNEQINECWISDRDRYSYEALNEAERLGKPMIRTASGMVEADWEHALNKVSAQIHSLIESHGADALGALVSPGATLEEFYLMQKLARGLGCANIDHRLRQVDFAGDPGADLYPGMGISIENLSSAKAIVLVGSNIRKEQPILGLRVRSAWKKGAQVASINLFDYAFHFDTHPNLIVPPSAMADALSGVLKSVCALTGKPVPQDLQERVARAGGDADCEAIAKMLCREDGGVVILGQTAVSHPDYAAIERIAAAICEAGGSSIGVLAPANSAAGWLAGCLPHRTANGAEAPRKGLDAGAMMREPRQGYLLFDVEPALDMANGAEAQAALDKAQLVVSFQAFADVPDYVDIALPIAPFTENSGTFVNCEGKAQWAAAAVEPFAEARPGWKILRVLGNFLNLAGFDYITIDQVTGEAAPDASAGLSHDRRLNGSGSPRGAVSEPDSLEMISEHSIYAADSVVRRAGALQQTADAVRAAQAHVHPVDMHRLGLSDGSTIELSSELFASTVPAVSDSRVPAGCVYLPAGIVAVPAAGTAVKVASANK